MSEIYELEKERVIEKRPQEKPSWLEVALEWNNLQFILGILIIVLAALSPLVVDSPYYMNIIIITILYAFVGLAWNIVGGFAGMLLIGFIPFFGFGAYTTIMLKNHLGITPWIGIFLAAIPAALLGVVVAYLTLRYGLKADYFALFTLALMVSLALIFSKWPLAGGAMGIWVTFRGVSVPEMAFVSKTPYLMIALGLLFIGLVITFLVSRSKLGKYLIAIRENEDAALALGVNVPLFKTIALVLAAAMAGVGGGFYVIFTTFIEPPLVFGLPFNVELLVAPIIGGRGTILGPILGAILNKPSAELIRGGFGLARAGTSLIIYGLFLIVFIIFLPRGVMGLVEGPYRRLRNRIINRREGRS